MQRKSIGFTIIELLVCMAIIGVLVGILVPVFRAGYRSANISASLSQLRQIHTSLLIYQQDNGGLKAYGTASQMNLPDLLGYANNVLQLPPKIYQSPCGQILTMRYGYQPHDDEASASLYRKWQEHTLVVADTNCNAKIDLESPYISRRGLGIRLSGELINRNRPGNFAKPEWWHDHEHSGHSQ